MGIREEADAAEGTGGQADAPLISSSEAGICEVISVGACDELPYVFELTRSQKLSFGIFASQEVDVVLCEEQKYEAWVDAGLPAEHPLNAILVLRHDIRHSLSFRPERDTMLVVIVINLNDQSIDAVVGASVRDSRGKLC